MNNPLKKFQVWRSQREQRELERWARVRAQGKVRFVVNAALTFGLTVCGLMDVSDRIFDAAQHSISLWKVVYYVLAGILVALIGWSNMEAKYQHALHEARLPALSSGDLPPNDDPLRITSD